MKNENINISNDFSKLSESFQALIENPELIFQFLDMFPNPVQIFDPDGLLVFSNRAFLEWNGIPDASLIVGKYNLKNDPVCNELDWMREGIQRAFNGETVATSDFMPPIQDFVDRDVIEEKPYESTIMDTYLYPVRNGDKLVYVVNVFNIKVMYQGRPEIAKAREYIDSHWLDEFDADAIAKVVSLNQKYLNSLFKRNTGMTMYDYYKKIKVEHIKEKLMDKSLSVAEAFSFCGEDSRGWSAKIFKELTGVTPTEYRNSLK